MWRDADALLALGQPGAVRAVLEGDDARAEAKAVLDHRLGRIEAGQDGEVVEARQADVGRRDRGSDRRLRERERPEPRPVIGVETRP